MSTVAPAALLVINEISTRAHDSAESAQAASAAGASADAGADASGRATRRDPDLLTEALRRWVSEGGALGSDAD
jgi:hypothetical protein